ncbi:MAG: Na/Pi cotransporter family protein, partial [Thermodesulfobacteriota bacterium]
MNLNNKYMGKKSLLILILGACLLSALPSLGAVAQAEGFSTWAIVMGLFGGLAVFLFGMEQMTDGLKAVAGEGMSSLLAKLTKNRFMAALTGAITTAVIQSSSITTVLVVGFITAGLMTLQQAIGIILGANVGTTITAQIIAFNVTQYALLLIAIGFAMNFIAKNEKIRLYGVIIMGLGMVFFGMGIMSDATNPLRTYEPFIALMRDMGNPLLGITVAALFTALVQSSSATTGITIVLASQGFITLDAGIALILGANVGTCVTAVLAAIGKPTAAKQAAAAHLIFNILGVLIWLPFIGYLADIVRDISPVYANLSGTARLGAETPRQIANAHTIFNIANTFIFIGFTTYLANFIQRVLPEEPEKLPEYATPKYLEKELLETPALALDRIRLEAVRLGGFIEGLTNMARPAVLSGTKEDLEKLVSRELELRMLHDSITDYARKLYSMEMTDSETKRLEALGTIVSNLQHIGETISVNMVSIGKERIDRGFKISEETLNKFMPYSS